MNLYPDPTNEKRHEMKANFWCGIVGIVLNGKDDDGGSDIFKVKISRLFSLGEIRKHYNINNVIFPRIFTGLLTVSKKISIKT